MAASAAAEEGSEDSDGMSVSDSGAGFLSPGDVVNDFRVRIREQFRLV
jgi:hypothetical protein